VKENLGSNSRKTAKQIVDAINKKVKVVYVTKTMVVNRRSFKNNTQKNL
jgi:hypothetical protein